MAKQFCNFTIVLAFILLCSACKPRQHAIASTTVTVTETCKQREILPAMAALDLSLDTANAASYLRNINHLLENPDSVLNFEVNSYLRGTFKNRLFEVFRPNVNRSSYAKEVFVPSSYLGFCLDADTNTVNHILADSGMLKFGTAFNWVHYYPSFKAITDTNSSENCSALVAIGQAHKSICLSADSFKEVRVNTIGNNSFKKLLRTITGTANHSISISLTDAARAQLKSSFSEDSILLLKCSFNNNEYYYTGPLQQLLDQFSFTDIENDQVL